MNVIVPITNVFIKFQVHLLDYLLVRVSHVCAVFDVNTIGYVVTLQVCFGSHWVRLGKLNILDLSIL
jgi:hypothetical protein